MGDTPRRATRAASRSATPAAALPSLQTRASTSYGSRGRTTLNIQTAPDLADDRITDALTSARPAKLTSARGTHGGRRSAVAVRKPDSIVESDSFARDDRTLADISPAFEPVTPSLQNSRPGTSLGLDAVYTDPSRIAGSMPPPPPPHYHLRLDGPSSHPDNSIAASEAHAARTRSSVAPLPISNTASRGSQRSDFKSKRSSTVPTIHPGRVVSPDPSSAHVLISTFAHYFPELAHGANPTIRDVFMKWFSITNLIVFLVLATAGVLTSIAFAYAIVPLPANLQPYQTRFVEGTRHAFGFSTHEHVLEELSIAHNELSRLNELRQLLEESRDQVRFQDEAFAELRRTLPDMIVVEKVEGEIVLSEPFWKAFEQRISSTNSSAPLWKAMLDAHSQEIEEKISNRLLTDLVAKDDYILAIRRAVNERIDDEVQGFEAKTADVAAAITREVAQAYIEKYTDTLSYDDRQAIQRFMRIRHNFAEHSKVNYFDPALGAMIIPHLTSATKQVPKSSWTTMRKYVYSYKEHSLWNQAPPIEAISHVFDASSCWCAAPSNEKGKAQIAVAAPIRFYPQSLVVEHLPASGLLDISTAPKTIEVWAELGSAAAVSEMLQVVKDYESSAFGGRCGPAPSSSAICILRQDYDIHFYNHVQEFVIWYPTEKLGLSTDRITVRVSENWGGDWTCVYRLRMHGQRADTDHVSW